MRYSQEFVWKAICLVLPHFNTMRVTNCAGNLPDALKSAAYEFFMLDNSKLFTPTHELTLAKGVVFTALQELRVNGYMEFDNLDDLSTTENDA